MAQGIDLTTMQRTLAAMAKEGKHDEAASLKATAVAAVWAEAKVQEAGYRSQTQGKCPRCKEEADTVWHTVWGCRCNKGMDNKWVQDSQHLVPVAYRGKFQQAN